MKFSLAVAAAAVTAVMLVPRPASAHCDTLDGPVVADASAALASKDVTLALRWVSPEKEGEVREAFRHALAVRALGEEARALADRFFFETLVRLHREGEGAPYTGLKPAGTAVDPAVAAADSALSTGSVEALAKRLTAAADSGIRERYAHTLEARKHAAEGLTQGRAYVAAYVEFVHYAERLSLSATTAASHEHAAEHSH